MKAFFFISLLVNNAFLLYAQKNLEYKLPVTREVVVYRGDLKVVAHVLLTEPQKKFKVSRSVYYQWFKEGVILQTKGGYKGNLLHGEFYESYANKQLKQKGIFVNGLKDSIWLSWYENGELREIAQWKNGMIEGEYQAFNDKGELIQTATYENGLLNGWKREFSGGKEISKTRFSHGKSIPDKAGDIMHEKKEPKDKGGKEKRSPKKSSEKRETDQHIQEEHKKKENKIKA